MSDITKAFSLIEMMGVPKARHRGLLSVGIDCLTTRYRKEISNLTQQLEEAKRDADKLQKIKDLVDEQANDGGIWFQADTAPEAYLQHKLRLLHAVIEGDIIND